MIYVFNAHCSNTANVYSISALCPIQALEEARLSIENQLKEAQELNKQLENRMAEAEREKQDLHEEKLKAVENVEKHVRSHSYPQHFERHFPCWKFTLYGQIS